jgi:UDP-glucuronate 4-epimerase
MIENNKTILITGIAGFIGFSLAKKIALEGYNIIGIDNLNSYYDVNLKYARLKELGFNFPNDDEIGTSDLLPNIKFIKISIEDKQEVEKLFSENKIDIVVNLAAQAGVRYSISNPDVYIQSNIVGFSNLIEASKINNIEHFIFASSSSVYGNSLVAPFKEDFNTDMPISIYAATKKSNELIAQVYNHLFNLKTTGLRFFTVYGPWGRPDMAPFLFIKSILEGESINVFNNGNLKRDFTYIDDIVSGILNVINSPRKDSDNSARIYNIGNGAPVNLMDFISVLEKEVGRKAMINYLPMQPGDVFETFADTTLISKEIGYQSQITIENGINQFVKWYKAFYNK